MEASASPATKNRIRARARLLGKLLATHPKQFEQRWNQYINSCSQYLRSYVQNPRIDYVDVFDRVALALKECPPEVRRRCWESARCTLLRECSSPVGAVNGIYANGPLQYQDLSRKCDCIRRDAESREFLRRLFFEERLDAAIALRLAYAMAHK